jgi:hypothetical protein
VLNYSNSQLLVFTNAVPLRILHRKGDCFAPLLAMTMHGPVIARSGATKQSPALTNTAPAGTKRSNNPLNSQPHPAAQRIRSSPDLVRKEAAAALICLAVCCLSAAVLDAPVQAPADPAGLPAEDVKAPWIFVGIQQLLRYLSPSSAGIILPGCAFLALAFLPFLPEPWRKAAPPVFFVVTGATLAITLWGYFT